MTSSLAHMLPDVNEVLDLSLEHGTFPDTGLPVAEILVLAGFLFIYTMEELLHMILVCTGNIQVSNNIDVIQIFSSLVSSIGRSWT